MEDTKEISTSKRSRGVSMSHDFSTLDTFFYSIAQFQFDQARDLVEKEKANFSANKLIWNALVTTLVTFADVEKSYFSMAFIERKIFRQTLKPIYQNMSTELETVIKSAADLHNPEALAADLCQQMSQFAQARLNMIEFYEYFVKCKWTHVRNTKEIISEVQKINQTYFKSFHHPILDPLKSSFNFEVEILLSLLDTEQKLCEWEFLESLLSLRECQSKLHAWRFLSPTNSTKELSLASFTYKMFFSRSSKKEHDTPALYKWLQLFHQHLLSKFSFYFYTTLNKQTSTSSDLKGTLSKNTIDYVSKVMTFQRKSDALSVSLVLDAASKEKVYKGHGYHMDNTLVDAPTGINSYPSVVSIPENITKEHWPSIISMLTDRSNDLNTTDKIVYFYDQKLESSYFLIKVDVKMTLVLIFFKMKKKERDSYVQNFLLEMRANLSHDKLFQMLKPSQGKLF